ncbi:hypothetical protein AAVH_43314, partial [Aphelenchoides avenae]
MDGRAPVKEAAIDRNRKKEQLSKSEQAEGNTVGKIEVLPEERLEAQTANKGDEEALFLD